MINFDDVTKENIKEHNPIWQQIPDPPYRISILEALDLENQIHYVISNHILIKSFIC